MNRVDPFFIMILVLLSALTVTYKAAQYDLSGLKFQVLINKQLQHKIKVLELRQQELELSQSRHDFSKNRAVASVTPVEEWIDPAKQAEKLYIEAAKQCASEQKDLVCVDQIDLIVTQFPDSKWAGESLILLTNLYLKNKKHEQARELIRVVRGEFNKYPDIIKKLSAVEKTHL